MPESVSSLFTRWATAAPDEICLVDEDGTRWTRSAYVTRLYAVGRALVARGHGPGKHVAIIDGTSRQHLDLDYGALILGAVRVPMDPQLTVNELIAQIREGAVSVVVVGGRVTDLVGPLREQLPEVDVIDLSASTWATDVQRAQGETSSAQTPPESDSLASLNFSGGTTGSPKAIMLAQSNLATVVRTIMTHTGPVAGPVFLNVRPLWPISAVIVLARLLGGARVVLARFDTTTFASIVRENEVTSTSLVPTQVVRLLDQGMTSHSLKSLQVLDIGAAPLADDARKELVALLGGRIGVNYGLTEAPWSVYLPPAEHSELDRVGQRASSVGRPFPGYGVRIVAPDGTICAEGESGEVQLSGAHVMQGYWRREDLTAEALTDGWFRTGDLGRLDEGYLSIVGRLKEVIRTGGKSVVPTEVEAVLRTHPSVADAAVIGAPDREWGETVVAYVELVPGRTASSQELGDHVRNHTASYKKPRIVHLVAELPRSHYGKVQKARLPELVTRQVTAGTTD